MTALLLLMLSVSGASLLLHSAALTHQLRQEASSAAVRWVERGYVRTAACRVVAASVYVAAAALQVAGVRFSGYGSLSTEALIIFTAVQGIWVANSIMDIRIRMRLSRAAPPPQPGPDAAMSADMERLQRPAPDPRPGGKDS